MTTTTQRLVCPTRQQVAEKTAEGRYVISESELVVSLRALLENGKQQEASLLVELLLARCQPLFGRYSSGLAWRPELREEAIADMQERLFCLACDPTETFITQNFAWTLQCLCVDAFKQKLRDEGLVSREATRRRPEHVPRSCCVPLLLRRMEDDEECSELMEIADPFDPITWIEARWRVQEILASLPNPRDRLIVWLRACEGLKWDEVAALCQYTERNVRLRFQRACQHLRADLREEDLPS